MRKWRCIVLTIVIFFVVCSFYSIKAFNRFTNAFYDFLIKTNPEKPRNDIPVVLVTATEKFVQEIGHEPQRHDYAKLLDLLGNSKIIVSDIFFPSLQSEKMDVILKNSFSSHADKIILPVFTPYRFSENKKIDVGYAVDVLNQNHPFFQSSVKHTGHINVFPDRDTVVRKCPAFIFYQGQLIPHVAIKALSILKNNNIQIRKFTGFKKYEGTIPVDMDGCFGIRFLNPSDLAVMVYPMEQVLSGKISQNNFKDKIIVIGHTIIGSKNADLIPTPFGVQFGALVQMQALYTVFNEKYIWVIDPKSVILIMFFIMLVAIFAFSSSFWNGTRFFIFFVLALLFTSIFLFKKESIFFDPVPGLIATIVSYAGFIVTNFFEARTQLSKGHHLLSVLEATQREIATIIRPQEMPGLQKRVYVPVIHGETFFNRTPQITLKTINSLLGISEAVIFNVEKGTKNINILVITENTKIDRHLISLALDTIGNDTVKIFNRNISADFKRQGISNFLILRVLQEPLMEIFGLFVNKTSGPVSPVRFFTKDDYQWIASFCLQIVVALFNAQLNDALKKSQLETIMRLAAAIEYRDRETGMHISRVSEYCALIASEINLPPFEVELIKIAVPLHDIGKIAIPDSILLKPSSLTEKEREEMKTHTIIGAKMLEGSDSFILQAAYLIALYHHEKFDGTGYPYGLKGKAIPLYGRIASLADIFDAISSKRVYKHAESFDESIHKIIDMAGKDFDPEIVDAFVKNRNLAFEIYTKYQEETS